MPRFAANLTMLFNEVPFLDRFERAAKAGFEAVEFLFPYAYSTADIKARLDDNGLAARAAQPARRRLGRRRARHRLPAGPASTEFRDGVGAGDRLRRGAGRGAAQLPGRQGGRPTCRDEKCRTTPSSRTSPTPPPSCQGGPEAADRADQHLRHPRLLPEPHAAGAGDHRRAWAPTTPSCSTTSTTRSAWKASWPPRWSSTCRASRHIQLADNPGRHEPGTGEINYAFLFAHLDRIGYRGWVGCEYKPAGATEEGLGWRQRLAL